MNLVTNFTVNLFNFFTNQFAGIKLGRQIEKLGMHSSDTAEIFFDGVRVPSRNIIGEEGRGFVYQMAQFQDERLVAVAVCKCY